MQKNVVSNEEIQGNKVRLISVDGRSSQIMDKQEAINQAIATDADLIQISKSGEVPVCRILPLEKYLYEEKQKQKRLAKKSKSRQMKELKIKPSIGYNDLLIKAKTGQRILSEGDDLKLVLVMRGREASYVELHKQKLQELAGMLTEYGTVKSAGKLMGKQYTLIVHSKAN